METRGTLRIFLYIAEPKISAEPVKYTKRTLYTGYYVTLDEATELKRHFEVLNALGQNGIQAIWQANPVELE